MVEVGVARDQEIDPGDACRAQGGQHTATSAVPAFVVFHPDVITRDRLGALQVIPAGPAPTTATKCWFDIPLPLNQIRISLVVER